MELKKGDWAGMKKDDPCGKLTFKDSKSKKNGAVVEEIEYKTLKHSKIEEIDDECAKRQLMKKKMLAAEGDYDKLDAKHKRIGKRLAILDKADEAIEAEMKNELEDLKKKKMRGAKKKLSGEINSTRSKCDPRQTMLKC
jgi:hypothetical protein